MFDNDGIYSRSSFQILNLKTIVKGLHLKKQRKINKRLNYCENEKSVWVSEYNDTFRLKRITNIFQQLLSINQHRLWITASNCFQSCLTSDQYLCTKINWVQKVHYSEQTIRKKQKDSSNQSFLYFIKVTSILFYYHQHSIIFHFFTFFKKTLNCASIRM